MLCAASGGRGYRRLWSPQGDKTITCGRRIPMGVLCRMGRPDQVGLWRHMTTYCCMGTHMVFSATSTSASGDWQCRPLAAVGCGRPLATGNVGLWRLSAVVGLRLAALLGLHPHVGLCRPLAALLWCHFPERDTCGRLGAAAVDQGTALAGFGRQGQRKTQNNQPTNQPCGQSSRFCVCVVLSADP